MPAPVPLSSRTSAAAAGWGCGERADIGALYREGYVPRRFSWFSPRPLWLSRNDRLSGVLTGVVAAERHRWTQAQRRRGIEDLTVGTFAGREEVSFLVLGDTGEGDNSQYHVVRPLLASAEGTSFTCIVSDVIYPAGDVSDYEDKFLHPYRPLPGPIYAVPGNHDWYDGLHGFMTLLCGADPDLRPPARREPILWKRLLHRCLWRQASETAQDELERLRSLRPHVSNQPGPYFAIELHDLLLVGIDTGIDGTLDAEQAAWLRTVSALDTDKILLTGKPLIANARRKEVSMDGPDRTVNALVENAANRYIAVIGGDIHNYQRYEVSHDGRTVQYVVSGAGGAYTKATHTIPLVTPENSGCTESHFRCYPRRGDSLATYSVLFDRRFGRGKGLFVVPREEAPALMSEHLGGTVQPTVEEDRAARVSLRARIAARFVLPQPRGLFHRLFSEYLDWDLPDPPLFKSFLRVDVRPGEIEIRCFGVTGCAEHESNPTLEDHIVGTRAGEGQWWWQDLTVETPVAE
ncbi:metallophosphoesterase family protein [Georgenia satyanarayanai]|uniref:metallophosphoesterase family protein n=1 Tax=Georgenia satyanarayanai TaxID=860221 RepID=UPI0012651FD4|nr:metallophosphoesterase [Georgenia satyanarayanai]